MPRWGIRTGLRQICARTTAVAALDGFRCCCCGGKCVGDDCFCVPAASTAAGRCAQPLLLIYVIGDCSSNCRRAIRRRSNSMNLSRGRKLDSDTHSWCGQSSSLEIWGYPTRTDIPRGHLWEEARPPKGSAGMSFLSLSLMLLRLFGWQSAC